MPMLIDTVDDRIARTACAQAGNRADALIEILHAVQGEAGCVSDAAIATIADALNRSRAEVLGVVSFYHDFTRAPGARHTLKLCRAEACQAAGGETVADTLAAALSDASDRIEIRTVYCLGNCALGPAAMLDGQLLGRVEAETLFEELAARGVIAGDSA